MKSNSVPANKTLDLSDSFCFNVEKNSIQSSKTTKDSRSPSLEETECTQHLISRKTLRGRKEKMSLPKNKLKCEICLQFSDFSEEDLLSCSTCKCLFHKSCYDQYEMYPSSNNETSSFKCIRCSYALNYNKSIYEYKCFICGNTNGVLKRNCLNGLFYHKICAQLLNEFKGLEEEDLCKEKIRRWRYKNSCRYCGEKLSKSKVVIKCKNPKCKEYFHIPCAIEKGMLFDLNYMKEYYGVSNFDEIPFYCSNHNKKLSFMYKTYVLKNNSYIKCKKNLNFREFEKCESEEKKTFLDYLEELSEKKLNENCSTMFQNFNNKSNKDFLYKKSNTISIIEEENINEIYSQDCSLQNENEEQRNKNMCIGMDESFENNNNNAFNLNFEKFLKENKTYINDECLLEDKSYSGNYYHNFGFFDSNLFNLKNDNDNLLCRQNSFNSLPFNI